MCKVPWPEGCCDFQALSEVSQSGCFLDEAKGIDRTAPAHVGLPGHGEDIGLYFKAMECLEKF